MTNQDLTVGTESQENVAHDDAIAKKRRMRSILAQVFASTAKNVLLFGVGLLTGLSTIVIADVHNAPADAGLSLTDEEVSWFSSVSYVTNPMGCVFSGFLSNKFGRRRSMQVLTIPILMTWIIFYFAESAVMLLCGAALGGFTAGLLEAPVLTYISEICEPNLRGILSATAPLSLILGMFTQYLLGTLMHWRTLSAICTSAPIVCFIVLFLMPESPHWLLGKKRFEDTKKSLRWLRGWTTDEHIQEEYDKLFNEIYPKVKIPKDECRREERILCSFNVKPYLDKTFLVPFFLILFMSGVVHFAGNTTLPTHAVNIFNSFGAPIDGYHATVLMGAARFFGSAACIALIHYTGKRILAFASAAGLGILTGTAGLYGYFYLGLEKLDNGAHIDDQFDGAAEYSWVPMTCFIGIPFVNYLGVNSLLWLLIGEVYPTEIRGFASGVSAGLGFLFGFAANKTFFDIIAAFTLPGVFIFYAVVAFSSLIVFYFWLPETEGWSLVEVQEHFAGHRNLIKAGMKKRVADGHGLDNPVPVKD